MKLERSEVANSRYVGNPDVCEEITANLDAPLPLRDRAERYLEARGALEAVILFGLLCPLALRATSLIMSLCGESNACRCRRDVIYRF